MPSVFTLDGPRLGTLLGLRDVYLSPSAASNARELSPLTVPVMPAPVKPGIRPGPLTGLGHAVRAGLGEVSDATKTALIAAGTLAVVGVVFYRGYARRRRRRGR